MTLAQGPSHWDSCVSCSASGMEAGKIEEMEKMLKEAHAEKSRLMESRVSGGAGAATSCRAGS